MSLTQAAREAYADPEIGDDIVHTLEMDHVSFEAPVRIIANSDEDLQLNLGEGKGFANFVACPMTLVLQGYDDDGPSQALLRIDNVSQILQPGLKAAVQAGSPLSLTNRGYIFRSLGQPADIRRGMQITRVSLFATYATGVVEPLGKADRQAFPRITYDVAKYKALHGLY